MEGPLSPKEYRKVLDTFKGGKTPGEGFTVEVYKMTFPSHNSKELLRQLISIIEQ